MRLVRDMVLECLDQTALSYACVTTQQDDVSVPSFHLLPTFQEQRDFRLSPDQRCESSDHSHIKATGGTTFTQDLIHGDRLSNASEGLGSQVLTLEISLNQSMR